MEIARSHPVSPESWIIEDYGFYIEKSKKYQFKQINDYYVDYSFCYNCGLGNIDHNLKEKFLLKLRFFKYNFRRITESKVEKIKTVIFT